MLVSQSELFFSYMPHYNRSILVLHFLRKKVKNRPNLKMASIFFPKRNLSGLFFYHTRDIVELKSEEFDNIVIFSLGSTYSTDLQANTTKTQLNEYSKASHKKHQELIISYVLQQYNREYKRADNVVDTNMYVWLNHATEHTHTYFGLFVLLQMSQSQGFNHNHTRYTVSITVVLLIFSMLSSYEVSPKQSFFHMNQLYYVCLLGFFTMTICFD